MADLSSKMATGTVTTPNLMLSGDTFVRHMFYNTLDESRAHIGKFYTPASYLMWNGLAYRGGEKIVECYAHLPSSEHTVFTLSVHSLGTGTLVGFEPMGKKNVVQECALTRSWFCGVAVVDTKWRDLVVNVSGAVSYGMWTPMPFHHVIVLRHVDEGYHILREIFRFTDPSVNRAGD